MKKEEKIKNIFAFLTILFGEKDQCLETLMDMHPDYIIEKFERYILSSLNEAEWGIHPSLRRKVFNRYCEKYNLPITLDL